MANLINVKLQEIHEGKRDYLRYKGRDGKYHFLDTKEMPDSDTNSVTYGQLVEMRHAALLEPGMLYRITDYSTTTVQENTRSAGHQFDIVVMALDSKTLAERAWAMPHEGDDYFKVSKLEAWQLWYCLDNDVKRFMWADGGGFKVEGNDAAFSRVPSNDTGDFYAWSDSETLLFTNTLVPAVGIQTYDDQFFPASKVSEVVPGGKGVIYRMIDEFFNDCPYDFKNIQFKRALTDGEYDPEEGEDVWCYTFTWIDEDGESTDASVLCQNIAGDEGFVYGVHDNSMLPCIEYDFYPEEHSDKLAFALNDNVFISSYQYEDGCFYGVYGNHFGTSCYSNTFGNECYNNSFGNYCNSNSFGNGCNSNSFGNDNYQNSFGNDCGFNKFGNSCSSNTFGNYCHDNTFGNYCSRNTFGNGCSSNTFGNSCYSNTFGNYFQNNSFGNNCGNNSFGNNFLASSIGANVNNIKVNKDYVQFILIENGNQFITITSTATTSDTFRLENFAIALGVNNGGSMKTISHNTTNNTFKTTYQNANSDVVDV